MGKKYISVVVRQRRHRIYADDLVGVVEKIPRVVPVLPAYPSAVPSTDGDS